MAEAPPIVPAAPSAPAPKPGAASAFPASTGEIHVGAPGAKPAVRPATAPGAPAAPAVPAKPSGKANLFKELEKKANGGKAPETPPAKPGEPPAGTRPAAAPEAKPGEEGQQPGEGEAPKPGEGAAPETAGLTPEERKQKPWKLVEDYKKKALNAAKELQTVQQRQQQFDTEKKTLEERAAKAEQRATELEKQLTFVDYSQTEEFKTTYVKPYEGAWGKAMEELRELTVPDGNGGERQIVPNDMLAIVNAPLAKARQMAEELFGNFANDVMTHRNTIRGLYEKQAAAIEDAKKNGFEKQKQQQEQAQQADAQLTKAITDTWQAENEAVMKNEKVSTLFKPRDGDDKWNTMLQQGYELVDKGFAMNPRDPKLTPEQRTEAIRRHAAIRNRAAGWGALRLEVERLGQQLKATQAELAQYKESEPGANGDRTPNPPGAPGTGGTAKEKMFAELQKRAKSR